MAYRAGFLTSLACAAISFFAAASAEAQLQVPDDKVYAASDVDVFRTATYDEVVTRQNSCTLTLTDFQSTEIRGGNYVLVLRVRFQQTNGSTEPVTKEELRLVFDDVIKIAQGTAAPIKLSLNDRRLASNIILSEVDNINIELRLIKVKDSYAEFMRLAQPILGVGISNAPTFQLVDNLLRSVSTGDSDQVVTTADLYVPANIFEYKRLKDANQMLLIQNNLLYGVTFGGNAPIPPDSLLGRLGGATNVVTRFVLGKNVVKPETVQYSGFVRLYLTKNAVPSLPAGLSDKLFELNDSVNSASTADAVTLAANVKFISDLATTLYQSKQLDRQTQFSVNEYLKLARIYSDAQSPRTPNSPLSWGDSFDNWSNFFDTRGAAVGAQAIGITGIYDDQKGMAKIYLPYSLPDDLIMSFYLWQVALHKKLKAANDQHLAVRRVVPSPPPPRKS